MWIFGLVERISNKLLLIPVAKRDEVTLISLIKKYVEPGSRIFSDGWSAYQSLNEHGYQYFNVIHKSTFKATYVERNTQERLEVHTNQIEGAWAHAKAHFKNIHGTKPANFESHLCEVLWRNWRKGGEDIF